MKTCKLIIVFIGLFISVNIMANSNLKVLTSTTETETGSTKVLTTFDESISSPVKKTEYQYNSECILLSKTIYLWKGKSGWQESQMFEYQCDDQNRPITTIFKEWNNKTQSWSEKSKQMDYSCISNE